MHGQPPSDLLRKGLGSCDSASWNAGGREINQQDATNPMFIIKISISTFFGHHYAHHQEIKTVYYCIWCSAQLHTTTACTTSARLTQPLLHCVPGRRVNQPLPSSVVVKERVELYIYSASGDFVACSGLKFTYRALNTLSGLQKNSQLILYIEMVAVCSEIPITNIKTLCEQNVEFSKC